MGQNFNQMLKVTISSKGHTETHVISEEGKMSLMLCSNETQILRKLWRIWSGEMLFYGVLHKYP